MSNVWVAAGSGDVDTSDLDEGDYVLRPTDGEVRVGLATGDGLEWLEGFDPDTLTEEARAELQAASGGLTRAEAQDDLLRAARGVHDARTHRGG